MTREEILLYHTAVFLIFYDLGLALDIAWEGELLEIYSEEKFQPVSQ